MIIAIPSKGRPTRCKSAQILSSATVFVPAAEGQAYRKAMPKQAIVDVPNRIHGITATRNWILDQHPQERVVFVDDDVRVAGWLEVQADHMKPRELTEAEWLKEWERLFDLAAELKFRIWGVSNLSARRAWYPWRPFLFYSYVTGSCMGIDAASGIRFDPEFIVKEDYEICLRAIVEDGGILAARYLFWENSHWTDRGGCREYRTQKIERDAIDRLMRMYPGMIRKVDRGGVEFSVNLDFL